MRVVNVVSYDDYMLINLWRRYCNLYIFLPSPPRPFLAATAPFPLQDRIITCPFILLARKYIHPDSPPFT